MAKTVDITISLSISDSAQSDDVNEFVNSIYSIVEDDKQNVLEGFYAQVTGAEGLDI